MDSLLRLPAQRGNRHGSPQLIFLNVVKGLAFVAGTAFALFFLVRAHLVRLRAADEHLERVERMRRLGEVAASITHDFNNILMTCSSFIEILRKRTTDPRSLVAIRHIADGLGRGAVLTREVLMFAQLHPPSLTRVPLAAFFETFADELRPTLSSIRIEQSVTPATLAICADPNQLHRLLMNLAVNARDAMGGAGTLTLTALTARDVPEHLREGRPKGVSFVEIAVSDTGPGVDPAVLARMFEPQFTTKRTGTGLGLAIVRRIAEDHCGCVRVSSRPGVGTTMCVVLPAFSGGDQIQASVPLRSE